MASNVTLLALIKSLQDQINTVQKLQGPKGEQGVEGPMGPRGPQGLQGDRGERGADGPRGFDGPAGEDGRDGEDGVGVVDVSQAADGDLVFHLSDGTELVVELPYGLSTASEGGSSTTINAQTAATPKDVFVSEAQPATETDQFIWIQTGLGDGSDFTVWFNDPRI